MKKNRPAFLPGGILKPEIELAGPAIELAGAGITTCCPYRKLVPNILMVKSAEVGFGHDLADGSDSP